MGARRPRGGQEPRCRHRSAESRGRLLRPGAGGDFARFGINRAAWDVLASLRRTGPPYRLSPTELYRDLMRTSGAITNQLHRLEGMGLVRRVPGLGDGRSILVELVLAAIMMTMTMAPVMASGSAVDRSSELEVQLLQGVRDAQFGEVVDYGPFEDVCPYASFCVRPAQPVQHSPNVDVAIIELDRDGRATAAANVLLSRDYPNSVVAPVDRAGGTAGSYGVSSVRWRRWDIDRHNGGTFSQTTGKQLTEKGWTANPPLTAADDIVAGRESAPIEFMTPYPASLFKLTVAFRIMRLVDAEQLTLKQRYTYNPTSDPLPDAAAKGKEEMQGGDV